MIEIGKRKGYFITIEGMDSCGKSTQIDLLRQALQHHGFTVRMLREPGGCKISEQIRDIIKDIKNKEMCPEAELLLLNAARCQLVREVIKPALDNGELVICDRFYHSTLLYQGFGRQLNQTFIKAVVQFAIEDAIPDVTFVLWLDPKEAEKRKKERGTTDRIEADKDQAFHERINQGVLWLKDQELSSNGRIVGINADNTRENIHNEIYRCVAARISGLDESQLQLDPAKKIIKV